MSAVENHGGPSSGASTVGTHLYTLLDSHCTRSPSLNIPFLHTYAPSLKGKERVPWHVDVGMLERTVETIRGVTALLEDSKNDVSKTKLVLALREISEHQASPRFSRPLTAQPSLPSTLCSLSPLELLQHLASKLSIQAYIEDSQFGLLKQSLALAGEAFVIDIDLETDPVDGNEDDDDMAVDGPPSSGVRLSKLTVNHVSGDATGKSDWVASVLRNKIGSYLETWNAGDQDEQSLAIASLESEFADLKELDGMTGANWFLELETVATEMQTLSHGASPRVYPAQSSVYPTIALLPDRNTLFRIRPSKTPTVQFEGQWLRTDWVLEHVSKSDSLAEGVIVGRTWLHSGSQYSQPKIWDGTVRMEHLLAQLVADRQSCPNNFAYASDYIHMATMGSLKQVWAMSEPGPAGLVLGHIRLPRNRQELEHLLDRLREQLVINTIVSRVVSRKTPMVNETMDGDMDALVGAPLAIPVTMTIGDRLVRVFVPVDDGESTLVLTFRPSLALPFIQVESEVRGKATEKVTDALNGVIEKMNGSETEIVDLVEVVGRVALAIV